MFRRRDQADDDGERGKNNDERVASVGLSVLAAHVAIYGTIALLSDGDLASLTGSLINIYLGLLLVAISFWDFSKKVIPDFLSIALMIGGLAFVAFDPWHTVWPNIGAAVCFGAFFFVLGEIYFRRTGREGLGIGDAKLIAAIAIWLGFVDTLSVVFLGALVGAVVSVAVARWQQRSSKLQAVAFGPFLCSATWYVWHIGGVF